MHLEHSVSLNEYYVTKYRLWVMLYKQKSINNIYCTIRTFHKIVLSDIKHLRGITVIEYSSNICTIFLPVLLTVCTIVTC